MLSSPFVMLTLCRHITDDGADVVIVLQRGCRSFNSTRLCFTNVIAMLLFS